MDDMKTYYCRRIEKDVVAERIESLTGDVIVQCRYDNDKQGSSCTYFNDMFFIDVPLRKRCLVKLAMQREIKKEKRNQLKTNL
jgi:hypothetical protein